LNQCGPRAVRGPVAEELPAQNGMGRQRQTWFTPTSPGLGRILCAEGWASRGCYSPQRLRCERERLPRVYKIDSSAATAAQMMLTNTGN